MKRVGSNIRKFLPSLAIGAFIAFMALLLNYRIFSRKIPGFMESRAGADSMAAADAGNSASTQGRNPVHLGLRYVAHLIGLADDSLTDFMFALRGNLTTTGNEPKIVIVAIDEESIQRLGSWPWSHRVVADVLGKTVDADAVGIDLLFDEPDKTSLARYVPIFNELYGTTLDTDAVSPDLMDNDQYLVHALAANKTVLGTMFYNGLPPDELPLDIVKRFSIEARLPSGENVPLEKLLLKQSAYAVTDLPLLRLGENPPQGEGFMNLYPSPTGVVRNVSQLAHLPSTSFREPLRDGLLTAPSLPLEMARVGMNGTGYVIQVSADTVTVPDPAAPGKKTERHAVTGVQIVRANDAGGTEVLFELPLNEIAEMEVPFRQRDDDFVVYPAWEVLKGKWDNQFAGKLVLVGGTVSGVGIMASGGAPMSVVEGHAGILSSMLRRDFINTGYHANYVWQQLVILLSGLAVSAALIFGSLSLGMLVSALSIVTTFIINYVCFLKGINFGITLPILTILAVLGCQAIVNHFVIGRERRFIRRAFSLNVSPSILGYLESHPEGMSALQSDYRDMTVMFSDIRGFTRISEQMTAPDLARFLNEYFTPMSDVIMANMGTVDKFMGDAIMAFWNAPADNPNHAKDAARSALAMLGKLADLQEGWTERGLPTVSIGCGVNSGPMFAGYMGSEQRKNYTVLGDNVNIASRLESLNKFYSSNILITEATRKLLGNDFRCRVVDKVRVSGKEEAIVIHELMGEGQPSPEEYEELASFARVFELYQMREFTAAESLLKELVFIRPNSLYKMYLDRLAVYLALPPPDDWDGTFSKMQK